MSRQADRVALGDGLGEPDAGRRGASRGGRGSASEAVGDAEAVSTDLTPPWRGRAGSVRPSPVDGVALAVGADGAPAPVA